MNAPSALSAVNAASYAAEIASAPARPNRRVNSSVRPVGKIRIPSDAKQYGSQSVLGKKLDHSASPPRPVELANQMARDRAHSDAQFSALHTTISERSKIRWPALGFMLSEIVVIGGMAYWPIRENQSELKEGMKAQIASRFPVSSMSGSGAGTTRLWRPCST
jgi:hypothetical protein